MKFSETDKIELKEKINNSLTKDIEDFLNTEGGIIYVGVDDNGKVVGVKDFDVSFFLDLNS